MAMVRRHLVFWITAPLLAGCSDPVPSLQPITYEHAADAEVLSIGVAVSDRALHVVWVEKQADGPQAIHSRSPDGGENWSSPVNIKTNQAPPDRVHRRNDIRVAAEGDELLVVWQTSGEGFGGAGPMVMARSDDGGRQWEAVEAPPATTADSPSHGFFALSATPDRRFHLAWLDNREGQQGLHYAVSEDGGNEWTPAETVVSSTCQCCWNTLAHTEDRTYLLYRGIDPRDMALAVLDENDTWSQPHRVGRFDWYVDACPHVGGGLAVEQSPTPQVHALVWTAAENQVGIHHFTGDTSGKRWQKMGRLGSRDARNSDLAVSRNGSVLAAWDEGGSEPGILAAWSQQGRFAEPVRLSPPEHLSSHPIAVTSPEAGYVFWTARKADAYTTWYMSRMKER